jgi:hypothetical protein
MLVETELGSMCSFHAMSFVRDAMSLCFDIEAISPDVFEAVSKTRLCLSCPFNSVCHCPCESSSCCYAFHRETL